MTADHLLLDFDPELIARLDRNGPRYTSYPAADRFVEAFDASTYTAWAAARNAAGGHRSLSIYVHLPFCSSLCYYCACNKVITRDRSKAARYLAALTREIRMHSKLLQNDSRVEQMHWGGGTPTFYGMPDLAGLFATFRSEFELSADGDYSIEIDPRTADAAMIAALGAAGFNRVSFGVQDFDPLVQRAINRVQSEEQTRSVIDAARGAGFRSINVDLIYGLPRQDLLTFNRTLARVASMRPDRVAVYNYAHLPQRFKGQRLIRSEELPSPAMKLKLLGLAVQRLTSAGYVYIGMDHFALPDDPLAVCQREGSLQRNFQGYSTHAECDLIGLGVSAIGAVGPPYSQNARTLGQYYECVDRGELPIVRGIQLTPDDLVRRRVIQTLMCHFELSKETIEVGHLIDFDDYFRRELGELQALQAEGLLRMDDEWITVTPKGRMLIRSICMVFDRYLRMEQGQSRYSRAI
jgi:oxygen-independent coproporphyrinogen-3 oxidase